MNHIDDYPNVLIVPENRETPEDIVEDYLELIEEAQGDKEFIRETFYMFFEDVNVWTVEQMLIDQARTNLQHLQEIRECAYEDDDFED